MKKIKLRVRPGSVYRLFEVCDYTKLSDEQVERLSDCLLNIQGATDIEHYSEVVLKLENRTEPDAVIIKEIEDAVRTAGL